MQNTYREKQVIHYFGIAGHGKDEIDPTGGLTKVPICRELTAREKFQRSSDMVVHLSKKFEAHKSSNFFFKELHLKCLDLL